MKDVIPLLHLKFTRLFMYRFILLTLSFLFILLSAEVLPTDKRLVSGRLSNGLHYYIMHNEKPKNIASFRLFVHAGSLEEEDDQRGLAHFIEHMAFNGTTHFKKNDLVSYLESIGLTFGGDLNANTDYERTLYKLRVPVKADNIDTSLQIMRDWAGGLNFNKNEFNKERGVVLEEKRLRNDANYRILRKFAPLFYAHSKYADKTVIGKEDILKHAPVQRAIDFYNKWYRPEHMALVIVGDIEPKKIEKKIQTMFSDLKNTNHAALTSRTIPENNTTRILTVTDKELSANSVQMFFLENQKGIITSQALKAQMINWMTTLMFNINIQKHLLATNTKLLELSMENENINSSKKATVFSASYKKEDREEAFEKLNRIVYTYARFGFKQSTFKNIKKQLLTLNENSHKGKANTLSSSYATDIVHTLLTGDVFIDEEYDYTLAKKLLKEITLEEVNARYRHILNIKDRAILFMGTDENNVSKEEALGLIEKAKKSVENSKKPTEAKETSLPPKPDKLAKIIDKKYNKKLNIYSYTLENNVTVDFKPTQSQKNEVVLFALSQGGESTLPVSELDNAHKAANWVVNSAPWKIKSYNMGALLADKKLHYDFIIERFNESIKGESVTKDFESLLHLIYLQVTQPKIDASVTKQLRNQLLAQLPEGRRNPTYRFLKAFTAFYYKNNPRLFFDTKESIEKLDAKQMLSIFKEKFTDMNHFHFVIVGDITTKKLETLIQRYLGTLPTAKKKETYNGIPYDYRKGKQHFIKKFNTENIANISLKYRTILPFSVHTTATLDALQSILTIRLRNIIREDKSGTYGIGVACTFIRQLQNTAVCDINFAADPKRKDELLAALYKAIKDFIEKGPTREELTNYQTEFAVAYKQTIKNNAYWLSTLQVAANFDTPLEAYLHINEEVKNLTSDEIKSVAKKIFTGDVIIAERIPLSF